MDDKKVKFSKEVKKDFSAYADEFSEIMDASMLRGVSNDDMMRMARFAAAYQIQSPKASKRRIRNAVKKQFGLKYD